VPGREVAHERQRSRLGGNSLWSEWFAGQLDDVRIYDTVLTSAQIQADMGTPVAP
jgi:hypothetical protein